MEATREQIVWYWLERLAARTVNFESAMNVTDETYINAAPVHVDHDYYQGHLLEIVERSSGAVSYIAVAEFHGPKITECDDCGGADILINGEPCPYCGGTNIVALEWDHDSMWYEPDCGSFFERTDAADAAMVGRWAVGVIYGMMESYASLR